MLFVWKISFNRDLWKRSLLNLIFLICSCFFLSFFFLTIIEFNNIHIYIYIHIWKVSLKCQTFEHNALKSELFYLGFLLKCERKSCWTGLIRVDKYLLLQKMINPQDRVFFHCIANVHTSFCLLSLSPSPIQFQARANRNSLSSFFLHL